MKKREGGREKGRNRIFSYERYTESGIIYVIFAPALTSESWQIHPFLRFSGGSDKFQRDYDA